MSTHRIVTAADVMADPKVRSAQRWLRIRRAIADTAWWWVPTLVALLSYAFSRN